jgi:transcriptional regulator GlxA family with amidase domain
MRFAIFIYPGTEPIDLATFGVLSMARRVAPEIEVTTVAPRAGIVELASGLQVVSRYGLDDFPGADVLIVTGGPGWEAAAKDPAVQDFLRRRADQMVMVSVCTGALILAAAGILDGRTATTKHEVVAGEASPADLLASRPTVEVARAKLVDEGAVITGGGVTLCIDTTLHLLKRYFGEATAQDVARILEYARAWKANDDALPTIGPATAAGARLQRTEPSAAASAARSY